MSGAAGWPWLNNFYVHKIIHFTKMIFCDAIITMEFARVYKHFATILELGT